MLRAVGARIARRHWPEPTPFQPSPHSALCYNPLVSHPSLYPPPDDFVRRSQVQGLDGYHDLYRRAEQNPEEFWGEIASREIHWFEKWSTVLEWNPPNARWFAGAK